MFLILLFMCAELIGAENSKAAFPEVDHRGWFSPDSGFQYLARIKIKAKEGPLKTLRSYYRENKDLREIEFCVVWEDAELYTIGKLKGRNISNQEIRMLFHVAKRDPEGEGKHSLISDIYSNTIALYGLSFTYGDPALKEKLATLSQRIAAGDYCEFLKFKEDL